MNDTAGDLDRADEDILAYEVSDEALEAAAAGRRDAPLTKLTDWRLLNCC